jgi:hypothetical protein
MTGRVLVVALLAAGCSGSMPTRGRPATPEEIAAARGQLDAADRALADEQEWCAVAKKQRLGSMGVPVKVTVNGTAVLLCCGQCEKKALADPEKTLASLEANRRRAAEERAGGKE